MSWLDAELSTVALCWRVERRDGVTIGLTAHDRDLVIDGLVHRSAPGMVPSAIVRGDGLDADTSDVSGALTSDAITEADLIAGRWDGARVRLFAVDWTGGDGRVALGEGTIGATEIRDGLLTAELRAWRRRWTGRWRRKPHPNVGRNWATGGAACRWRGDGASCGCWRLMERR